MKYRDACLRLSIALAFLCACLHGSAQPGRNKYIINTARLTVEDGLITNTTLCGLQDGRGFIWIGTTNGLQRYDGKSFRLFNKEVSGLQGDKIGSMAEDRDGRLWIHYGSNEDALLKVGRRTDLMDLRSYSVRTLAQSFGRALPFAPEELKWFFADERHNLFLITGNNALWWYRGGGVFRQLLQGRIGFSFYPHGSLYQAWGGHIWLSSDSELVHVDTLGNFTRMSSHDTHRTYNVFHLKPDGSCTAFSGQRREMASDRHLRELPRLYEAGPAGGILPTAEYLLRPVPHARPNDYLVEYRADIRTRCVMMHNPRTGLQLVTDTGAILLLDTATLASESPLSPYAYFTDRGGGHWLCTSLGIFRFRISPAYFHNYLTRAQVPAATAVASQARGIWSDGHGCTYVGRDGLYEVCDSSRGASVIRLTDKPVIMVQGDSDRVWYSWQGKGYRLSYRTADGGGREIRLPLTDMRAVWCLYHCRDGRQLVGGDQFIGYIAGDSAVALQSCSGAALSGTCYQFFEDGGRLWAVTSDGLYEVRGDCFSPYAGSYPLAARRLYYVHAARDGAWWICTAGDGLICWNRERGVVRRFGVAEGMPSNVLYACLEDAAGFFWISSDRGLIRLNPATGAIRVFTKKDGLPDNEFNRISWHQAGDGSIYFGGLNGVSAFQPAGIPADMGEAAGTPLQVITLQAYNAALSQLTDKTGELLAHRGIVLRPDEKFLTIEVALLDFTSGTHQYGFMVEGLDAVWRYSADGSLRLDNLPYGKYTLRIRGRAAEGAWSIRELRIPLRVMAPFYRRWPFLAAVILIALLLLWTGIRARVRILKRANRRLELTVDQRTQELRELLTQKDMLMKEIHHRVKNNLQVISSLQQMQASRSNNPQVRAALEESQNRVLSIAFIHHNLYQHDDLKGVEMASFVAELVTHVQAVFARPDVTVTVERDIPALYLDIDTAVPLGLMINELLTNAFKYAFAGYREGLIHISITPQGTDAFLLLFSDNGIGLPEGLNILQARSLGLRLISQLSRQLGGVIDYERSAGSHFRLLFKNHEARNGN